MKTKTKTEMKTKMKIKLDFYFCFHFDCHFHFCFWFCFLKVFAFLLTHVFRFWPEILFLGKFGPKNQNSKFKVKLGTYTKSNMQNSMGMFTLFVFGWKYSFWANLAQKIKIFSSKWNVIPGLIRIWRIQWWCSLFFIFNRNYFFGG